MGRLFDSKAEGDKAEAARLHRAGVKQRADEVDRILSEEGMLDAAATKLGSMLTSSAPQAVQSVEAIHYTSFRRPGSKWVIEHAKVGPDYVFQLFPLKAPGIPWQDIITILIAAMDVIFPRSVKITYIPPNDAYQVKYFTIKVEGVVGLPGWEVACKERALLGLAAVDAWSRPAS
jgi:hypothetical protein